MMRIAGQTWIKSDTGDLVPPAVDWLFKRLSDVSNDRNRVREGAFLIHAALLALEHPADTGQRVRGKVRLRTGAVRISDGPTVELERLLATASGGSEKEFMKRWLATSTFVRQLVDPNEDRLTLEKQHGPDGELTGWRRSFDRTGLSTIKAGRLVALVPAAKHALPKIKAALAKVREMSPSDLKTLKSKYVTGTVMTSAEFPTVVRQVYQALTGRVGVSHNPQASSLRDTALVRLCRDIDANFGVSTYKPGRIKKRRIERT